MAMLRRSSLVYRDADLTGAVMAEVECAAGNVVTVLRVDLASCVLRRDVEFLRGEASDERSRVFIFVFVLSGVWW